MAGDKAGRVIFIGNIPYGLTEEQIMEIFSNVGHVLSFRLVYDKDSGRPKGFGFAEFADADAAASAVRNLNNHEVMGRHLRVDYSNDGGDGGGGGGGGGGGSSGANTGQANGPDGNRSQQMGSNGLPQLPPGAELAPGLTCPDAISHTLSQLQPPQLLDIISQMKGLVMSDASKATDLLTRAPQLSYAIFQSLLLLGLVDTSALASVVEQASSAAPPAAVQPPSMPSLPPQFLGGPAQGQQAPQQPNQQQQYGFPGMHAPTPPQPQGYAPPPPPQPQQMNPLHQQVLALTQQQLDAMPPMERAQLMQIRQQILAGQFG